MFSPGRTTGTKTRATIARSAWLGSCRMSMARHSRSRGAGGHDDEAHVSSRLGRAL